MNKLILCLVLGLVACDEQQRPSVVRAALAIPAEPIGAKGKTDVEVFRADGKLVDRNRDSDGDGISDGEELSGWPLTLDPDGWTVFLDEGVPATATSDPRFADSDGDGLDDGAERTAQSDPRKHDTDGDGLSDVEEVQRFGTNPSRADSDGDATGGDPTNPRPPIAALFDAAELRLEDGPDGRRAGVGATNPTLADTDGDGMSDYDELLSGARSPVVAEIPSIGIDETPGASLDMFIHTTTSQGQTDTRTTGHTIEFDESGTLGMEGSQTLSAYHEEYGEVFAQTEDTAGCCTDIVKSENEAGIRYSTSTKLTHTLSMTFSGSTTLGGSYVTNEARAREQRGEITMTGGTVRLSVDAVNTGPVAARLSDVAIGLSRWDPYARAYVPVSELLPTVDSDGVLGPGERRTLVVADEDVPLADILALMDDPRRIHLTASRFTLTDEDGQDFDYQLDAVEASTVVLHLDMPEGARRVLVAPAEPAAGITLRAMLESAGIGDFEIREVVMPETGDHVQVVRIGTRATELYPDAAPPIVDSRPYTVTSGPGPRWTKRGWFVQVRRADGQRDYPYYPSMLDAVFYVGDQVWLTYDEDLDRDGVPAIIEGQLGSSDAIVDSDANPAFPEGDGLSDFWEAYESWEVSWVGRTPYRVRASPGALDVDADGLDDRAELDAGTDPFMADTDLDSIPDGVEVAAGGDPLLTLEAEAQRPTASCEVDRVYTDGPGSPLTYQIKVSAADAQEDLMTVLFASHIEAGTYASMEVDRGVNIGGIWTFDTTLEDTWDAIAVGQAINVTTDGDGVERWESTPGGAIELFVAAPYAGGYAALCFDGYGATEIPFPMNVTAVDRAGHQTVVECRAVGLLAELGCLE